MTAIILPDRWRKQPRHLVRTRGHFAHGIVWSAGGGVYSAHGKALTLAGVSHVITDGHHAFSTDGATGDNIDLSAFPETPPPWTYLIRLRRRADQQDARLHTPISGSSVAALSCNVGGSTTLDILDYGFAWEPIGSMADVFPVGVMRTLVVSMSATKDVKAYAFGKVVGSTTIASSSFLNLGGAAYIGGIYLGSYGATVQFDVAEIGLTSGAITEGEAIALSFATYGELFVKAPRILYFDVGGGPAEHASSGILTGPGSVIAGTGANLYEHQSSGALTGPGSVVVGTGANAAPGTHDTLGALVGPGSSIAGTGAVANLHTTSGILVGPGASITGTGSVAGVHASSGALAGPGATIAGVGTVVGTTTLTQADIDAIWDNAEIEPGISARMALRILLAAVGGKRVGLGTAIEQYMAQDGVTPRITFSPIDEAGNGTPVVDGS